MCIDIHPIAKIMDCLSICLSVPRLDVSGSVYLSAGSAAENSAEFGQLRKESALGHERYPNPRRQPLDQHRACTEQRPVLHAERLNLPFSRHRRQTTRTCKEDLRPHTQARVYLYVHSA